MHREKPQCDHRDCIPHPFHWGYYAPSMSLIHTPMSSTAWLVCECFSWARFPLVLIHESILLQHLWDSAVQQMGAYKTAAEAWVHSCCEVLLCWYCFLLMQLWRRHGDDKGMLQHCCCTAADGGVLVAVDLQGCIRPGKKAVSTTIPCLLWCTSANIQMVTQPTAKGGVTRVLWY